MLSVDISLVPYLSLLCGSHWRKNCIKYRDRRYVSKFTIQTPGKSIERFELKHFPFLSQQLRLTLSWDFSWLFFFFFFFSHDSIEVLKMSLLFQTMGMLHSVIAFFFVLALRHYSFLFTDSSMKSFEMRRVNYLHHYSYYTYQVSKHKFATKIKPWRKRILEKICQLYLSSFHQLYIITLLIIYYHLYAYCYINSLSWKSFVTSVNFIIFSLFTSPAISLEFFFMLGSNLR